VAPGVRPPQIPYTYISTQVVSKDADLRSKYDVIIFGPGAGGNAQAIVNGRPMYGNPLPWKVTPQTPNLAKTDETDDMRPGLGWTGLDHLQDFVNKGGLFITANDTATFAVTFGFAPGSFHYGGAERLKVTGSAVRSKIVDGASPILYGYSDNLAIFASNPPLFGCRIWLAAVAVVDAAAARATSAPPAAARPTIPISRRAASPRKSPKSRTARCGKPLR
jgi:hypothetical protein